MTLLERFEAKYIPEPNSGCWLWIGSIAARGYGRLHVDKRGYPELAHRVAWMLFNGPIPEDALVCHTCDVPHCVNPDHLWIGTHAENTADMFKKGRNRHTGAPGERNAKAKITKEIASAIRCDPRPVKELAAEYGMCLSNIYRIKSGFYWK